MNDADYERFRQLLKAMQILRGHKQFFAQAVEWYFTALAEYDLETVRLAIIDYFASTGSEGFSPTVRLLIDHILYRQRLAGSIRPEWEQITGVRD